ncbi:hypothetical protein CB1_000359007 [Camelus ferus]|nr:hypothetical protein CB1_000359007 [Camelus ferus]
MPAERLDQLTLVLLQSAHRDCSGAITFGELRAELQGSPGPRQRRPRPLTSAYWHNHRSHLLCLVVHAGLPLLLLALAASAHRALGASVMVAKGCGQCFNFDCSFIAGTRHREPPRARFWALLTSPSLCINSYRMNIGVADGKLTGSDWEGGTGVRLTVSASASFCWKREQMYFTIVPFSTKFSHKPWHGLVVSTCAVPSDPTPGPLVRGMSGVNTSTSELRQQQQGPWWCPRRIGLCHVPSEAAAHAVGGDRSLQLSKAERMSRLVSGTQRPP